MSQQIHHDEISLTSFRKDFERYSWSSLRSDFIAGISVAMLTVPQALAFALVAGLPVSAGIYASIFSAIIVAFFGSSRHLIVGPSNAIAILIQGGMADIFLTYYRDVSGPEREELVLLILTQLMLLVGAVQMLAAFLKLGRLTHFVSHTVIVGYLLGVAFALVVNQLFPLLGMSVPGDVSSLFERGAYILTHFTSAHGPTAIIGAICLLFLFGLRRLNKNMPSGAIMLVCVALIAYLLDYIFKYSILNDYSFINWINFEGLLKDVAVVGDTRSVGLIPNWSWPYFDPKIMNHLIPVAFAIGLLSVMEATSASKSIASSSGQHLSTNQEIFGLGIGNFFSSFIGAMPVSGSASRSAINYENGGKTRLAAIFSGLIVALILFVFGFLIRHIPIAAFAALLIISSANIVNLKQLFLCFKATRSDALVFLFTFLSCIFFSLDMALYIGVVMSITLYLKKAAVPQLVEFCMDERGLLQRVDLKKPHEPRKIRLIKVQGELFFGAADLFQTTLKSLAEDDTTTRVIILELKNARDIDATACLALQHLYHYLKTSGRYLIACGITHQIWDILSDSGIVDLIGKPHLFILDERQPTFSIQKAFARANDLLKAENAKVIELEKAEVSEKSDFILEPSVIIKQDFNPAIIQGEV